MTTTDTIPENTETFARLTPGLIDPDPENRSAPIDADFKKSIAQHGVLEPVLVVPHPSEESRYMLVAGERRWCAAVATECTDIPAVIDTSLNELDRVIRQITENLHRLDVTPAAEANQFMRLANLGMGVGDLAKQIGRSQRYVRDQLRIAELPSPAQALVDERRWTIEDGLAATQLLDAPDQLTELIEDGRGNITYRVERVLADIERENHVRTLVDAAQEEGKTLVLADDNHTPLADLSIVEATHQGEDCHAYIVHAPNYGAPKLVPVCTDRRAHTKRGKSAVKAAKPAPANPRSETEAAQQRAKRDANNERADAIAAVLSVSATSITYTAIQPAVRNLNESAGFAPNHQVPNIRMGYLLSSSRHVGWR